MSAKQSSLGKYFLPYQIAAITSEERLVLWEKSIRVGATYCMSFRAVRRRLLPNTGNYLHTSVNERIAKSFIMDCKKFCRVFEAVFKTKVDESEINEFSIYNPLTDRQESAFEIFFNATGQSIKAFSSNPDALRGEGGDVGIDELSSHKQPEELMQAAGGRAMWGNSIHIWTSHKGTDSVFNRMIQEERAKGEKSRWKIWSTDLYQALDAGLLEKINAVARTSFSREEFISDTIAMVGGMEAFEEECLLKPRKSGGSAIAWSLIDAARSEYHIERYDITGKDLHAIPSIVDAVTHQIGRADAWIGYDVARRGHLSAIPVLRRAGPANKAVAMILIQDMKFGDQRAIIDGILTRNPQASGLGDSTGLGMQVCEELEDKFGKHRFAGVNFGSMKGELGSKLTRAFEDSQIILPSGTENDDIAYDIRGIRTEPLPSGRIRYFESSNPVEKRSHCDIAWALALANYAAAEELEQGIL